MRSAGGRGTLLVRTDASEAVGMGHATRCLSLAQAHVRAGGRASFLMAQAPAAFLARAERAGAEVRPTAAAPGSGEDLAATVAAAEALDAGWIVLDGYQFDGAFQAALVARGRPVLALDDHGHAGSYHADLVLNQNAGADPSMYGNRAPDTRLLLGPRYALLREEFREWRAPPRRAPQRARRVVLTFGGSDPEDLTRRALEGLAAVPGPLEVLLLIGPANPRLASLKEAASRSPHAVEVVLDPRDMASRLAWGEMAVAGAGVTALELARVGTPQLAVVLAENQWPGALALADQGIVINLGWHAELSAQAIGAAAAALADDAARRAELSRRGRELVDGRGAERVLAAMGLAREPPL